MQTDSELLHELERVARIGAYVVDVAADSWSGSEFVGELLGVTPGYPRTLDAWGALVHPDDRERVVRSLREEVIGRRQRFDATYRIVRPSDGEIRWVHGLGEPVLGEDETVVRIRGTIQDVTERRISEAEIAASQQRLSLLVEQAPLGVIEWNTDFEVVFWNPAAERIFGYPGAEAMGRHSRFIVPPSARPHVDEVWRGLLTLQGGLRSLNENVTKDGRVITCEWYNAPLLDANGAFVAVVSVVADITDQVEAERALRDSEERWRFALEGAGDGVWDWNAETNEVRYSHQWKAMLGYADDEIGGTLDEWKNRVHPEDLAPVLEIVERHLRGETPTYTSEHRVRCKDGSYKWVLDRGKVITRGEDGRPLRVIGTHTDLTERRRVEDHIRLVRERLEATLDALPDLMFDVDAEGRIHDFRARVPEMLYVPPAVFLGKRFRDVLPGDVAGIIEGAIAEAGRLGQHRGATYSLRLPGGERWFELSISACGGAGEAATRFVLLARDITQRKALEDQLRHAQRLDSIGRLAGGVAHDFNNILAAILGQIELALLKLPEGHPVRSNLEESRQATERASALTRQLLAFARRQSVEARVIDLNELIVNLGKMLQRLIGEHIELVTNAEADPALVRADPGQIEQVLLNLAVNARDAMAGGGTLTIATSNRRVGDVDARQHVGLAAGDYVVVCVRDTGTGMTDEVKAHVFEPFFTTKAPGKGTGLGLATSFGIIEQAKGHILLESALGSGTTFTILLPCAADTAKAPTTAGLPEGVAEGKRTILLTEDEPAIRQLIASVLRAQGYTVIEAADGVAALSIMDERRGAIDLLITDVVMPGLSGQVLADKLAQMSPATKLLLISGYLGSPLVRDATARPGRDFLQKPFTQAELCRKVREILKVGRHPGENGGGEDAT